MPNGGIMNEDEIKGMLPSIPTSMLVGGLNRRQDEWREAERSLGLGVPPPVAPVSTTQRARHFTGKAGIAGVKAKTTGSAVISAAKRLWWAKKHHAPKTEIAELERAVEQAKAANLRE